MNWNDIVNIYDDRFYFVENDELVKSRIEREIYDSTNHEFVARVSNSNFNPEFIHNEINKYLINRRNTLITEILCLKE